MIMEVHRTHLVVLTPLGEFQKVHRTNNSLQIGDQVLLDPITTSSSWKPYRIMAAVLLIFFLITGGMMTYSPVYAYVSVDINPSVEIAVNSHWEPISISSKNEQGKKILQSFSTKKVPLDSLLKEMVAQATHQGYLSEDKRTILLTVVYKGSPLPVANSLDQAVEIYAQEILDTTPLDLHIYIQISSMETRKAASKENLSTGQYTQIHTPEQIKDSKKPLQKKSVKIQEKNQKVTAPTSLPNEIKWLKEELKDAVKNQKVDNPVKANPNPNAKVNTKVKVEPKVNAEKKEPKNQKLSPKAEKLQKNNKEYQKNKNN